MFEDLDLSAKNIMVQLALIFFFTLISAHVSDDLV